MINIVHKYLDSLKYAACIGRQTISVTEYLCEIFITNILWKYTLQIFGKPTSTLYTQNLFL